MSLYGCRENSFLTVSSRLQNIYFVTRKALGKFPTHLSITYKKLGANKSQVGIFITDVIPLSYKIIGHEYDILSHLFQVEHFKKSLIHAPTYTYFLSIYMIKI